MRKLYTEYDERRVGGEGLQSCSSRLVSEPDTLTSASPPNYGSFAVHRQHITDGDDGEFSAPMTEMTSFETEPVTAGPTGWRWKQWSRWKAWWSTDSVKLADSIDEYSRIGFPFVFIVLSIIYWVVYLQIRPTEFDDDFVVVDWLTLTLLRRHIWRRTNLSRFWPIHSCDRQTDRRTDGQSGRLDGRYYILLCILSR